VVRGHLLLRVLFGGKRRAVVILHFPLQGAARQRCSSPAPATSTSGK
jgi:hypothetical protein